MIPSPSHLPLLRWLAQSDVLGWSLSSAGSTPVMVPREWAEGCPHRGSNMTSGVSVGVFLGEVSTGMGGLNKERGWASFLGGPDRARRPRRVNSLFLSRDIRLLPSDIRAPRSPALGRRLGLMPLTPRFSDLWIRLNSPPASLGLQLPDSKRWDFSACGAVGASNYNQSPLTCILLYIYRFMASGEPNTTPSVFGVLSPPQMPVLGSVFHGTF